MSITRKDGSAAIEMTFIFVVFAIFLNVVTRLSALSSKAHGLSIRLQDDVDKMMVEKGRPSCIDQLDTKKIVGRAGGTSFGGHEVVKQLVFSEGLICE